MEKFFIIDTMAILYRSYFALIRNPMINSKGINVSGLFGLVRTLIKILETEQPDYLAVVSDSPDPTFRHVKFPEYKATREKMPEELVMQLPYIPRIVEALNLPYLILPGFEADDIAGTLVERAKGKNLETFMVTGDKDYMQLVSETAFMYSLKGDQVALVGIPEVEAKFGCKPEGVIEVLALMGDASDNVPGVKGVGEKTATKLVAEYGTLENLYEHLADQKGKLKEKLETDRERAFLSRELVTIHTSVPLAVDFASLSSDTQVLVDNHALIDLMGELEFQSLRDKLLKTSPQPEKGEAVRPVEYTMLDSLEAIKKVIPILADAPLLILDTETTGLDYFQDSLVGLSFSISRGSAWYVPLNAPGLIEHTQEVLALFAPLLANPLLPKGGHNIKFDMHMLAGAGLELNGVACDTMIASHMSEPGERKHDLDSVALRMLGIQKIPTESLIGKGKDQTTMDLVSIPEVSQYACEDADVTFRLAEDFAPRLEHTSQKPVFDNLEMPLIPVLMRMEQNGIRFDKAGSEILSEELETRLKGLVEEIYDLAGERDFNINSVPDLQKILYQKLELHKKLNVRPKKIKTGLGMSTDEETLEKLSKEPLPKKLLDYRQLNKLKNTYLDQLKGFINPVTGKIHTSFRQAVAQTGRLASDHPNLQNIPVRSEEGRKVRALFLPSSENHILLSADYSQIELRVVADYSEDPTFMKAFQNGEDIHALTAEAIFDVPAQDISREMRSVAKEVNFGLIFKMGPDRLAQVTGTSRIEAKEFIERFFQKYSTIRDLQEELIAKARTEGYAQTTLGRRRYLGEINSSNALAVRMAEGMAVNTPIQGTAAEIIKLAMIAIDARTRKENLAGRMVLTIHDELLFDVPLDELSHWTQLVTEEMEQAMQLKVPLKVDTGTGKNWLEAH